MLKTKSPISFEQDANLVKSLLEELLLEQSALVRGDIELVESIIDRKFTLLQQLSSVAKNRYEVLANNGFEANESGMVAWIKLQADTNMQKAWDRFQMELARTKETNRLNGVLINKHFNRNQQLLNHLQGKQDSASVYGKNGQAKTSQYNRSVLLA
ncbi:MAG TPA: flagellar protein FlgN [Methylotenera sp.]|nr:flagellar protein FlgN [Methylotenera sp.]HPH04950.1 flagellar protein FlgN [Methylotenera sp.]HPN02208.1 flagellar protein FlgN [Methylotenera sp.]